MGVFRQPLLPSERIGAPEAGHNSQPPCWQSRSQTSCSTPHQRDLPALTLEGEAAWRRPGCARQEHCCDGVFRGVASKPERATPAGGSSCGIGVAPSRVEVEAKLPQDRREDRAVSRLAVWLLDQYKRWLSPLLPRSCRFSPTCAEYSRLAFIKYGFWRGSWRTAWRLARCHPLAPGGVDLP